MRGRYREKAVLFDMKPSEEKVKDLLSSCMSFSSSAREGLSGEQEILEFVQVGWWANLLNRVVWTS